MHQDVVEERSTTAQADAPDYDMDAKFGVIGSMLYPSCCLPTPAPYISSLLSTVGAFITRRPPQQAS
eukprot:9484420-Pyramimonas_sp.AAC.1